MYLNVTEWLSLDQMLGLKYLKHFHLNNNARKKKEDYVESEQFNNNLQWEHILYTQSFHSISKIKC